VPAKRKERLSPLPDPKRGKRATQTPPKQVQFFTSPACPPSPHHKPRASSPLRESAVSPTIFVHRPEKRTPLGELAISVQQARRPPSPELKVHDWSSSKFTHLLLRAKSLSPAKTNNKENVAPFRSPTRELQREDRFARPSLPPTFGKVQKDKLEEIDVVEERAIEEITSTEHISDGKVVRETSRKKVSTTTFKHVDLMNDTSNLSTFGISGFEIFQDPEDATPDMEVFGHDEIGGKSEDDKENAEPRWDLDLDGIDLPGKKKTSKITKRVILKQS
jgi:hypothetical protein